MEVSAASEADEAAEVIEVGEDLNGSEIIQCVKQKKKCWFFETIGITEVIEASEFIMVNVIFEAFEGLTSHLDTYFSNLVTNTIYFFH